jgi:hypothetical protein
VGERLALGKRSLTRKKQRERPKSNLLPRRRSTDLIPTCSDGDDEKGQKEKHKKKEKQHEKKKQYKGYQRKHEKHQIHGKQHQRPQRKQDDYAHQRRKDKRQKTKSDLFVVMNDGEKWSFDKG